MLVVAVMAVVVAAAVAQSPVMLLEAVQLARIGMRPYRHQIPIGIPPQRRSSSAGSLAGVAHPSPPPKRQRNRRIPSSRIGIRGIRRRARRISPGPRRIFWRRGGSAMCCLWTGRRIPRMSMGSRRRDASVGQTGSTPKHLAGSETPERDPNPNPSGIRDAQTGSEPKRDLRSPTGRSARLPPDLSYLIHTRQWLSSGGSASRCGLWDWARRWR